jgi:hypothetical protein
VGPQRKAVVSGVHRPDPSDRSGSRAISSPSERPSLWTTSVMDLVLVFRLAFLLERSAASQHLLRRMAPKLLAFPSRKRQNSGVGRGALRDVHRVMVVT